MSAPWSENPARVVVEFKKASAGTSRQVNLTHRPDVVPPQLQGRIKPEMWAAFMNEAVHLAQVHPYTAPATADCCMSNICGGFMACVVGFGFFQGDAGDYNRWLGQVQQCIARHQPGFAACGVTLSLQSAHGSYWIQLDIAGGYPQPPPGAYAPVAYGAPAAGYPYAPSPAAGYAPMK